MSGAILSKKIMPLSICIEIRAQHLPWLCILLENLLPTIAIVKSWSAGWNPPQMGDYVSCPTFASVRLQESKSPSVKDFLSLPLLD